MHEAQSFARVVVPSPLKDPLIYSVPHSLGHQIAIGSRVLVPLQRRTVTGVVWEVLAENPIDQAKPIIAALDDKPILDEQLLKLCAWISQYYLAPLGEVVATMLPPNSRRESKRTAILRSDPVRVVDELSQKVVDELRRQKGKLTVKTLTRKFLGQNIERILSRLEAAGAVQIEDQLAQQRTKKNDPFSSTRDRFTAASTTFSLTGEQGTALNAIEERIARGGFETFLVHGVTGSGKTEVYLRAMERVRGLGRRSLILIPEISLTPQLLDRLDARFPGRVGVLHSGLTDAERWAQWWRIARGNIDVVVGARSAVFAPVPNLGLIVVDEEHDPSYKQDEGLRYNGRDVAVVRGRLAACPVVLGSATPALESYENCRQGRYRLLEITQRVEARPLPTIETIDLRRQFRKSAPASVPSESAATGERKKSEPQFMTESFLDALTANLRSGHQTLIFLNRRGFANFLQCSSCGHVWRCPHCSVTLTVHLKHKSLACHHCDYRRPTTEICPECHNDTLAGVGAGTEQIEEALRRLVPSARIARMDRDTTARRGSQEQLIRRWEKGDFDILIGTQMIAKGHDVFGVTLVGALLADLSLNLPDFRAAERTFQLLSQVAGRSGRGDDPGRVLIQTFAPDHYTIQFLINHDYKGFFVAETEFRRALGYPPFSRLVGLRLDGPKTEDVESQAKDLAAKLRDIQARTPSYREQVEVLGPAPAPIEKLRNRYRWQLLLKGKQSSTVLEFAGQAQRFGTRGRHVRLHIDVDPYSML
jgi:primosomal protein N' (replication factor Y) (superfamily II helicase)